MIQLVAMVSFAVIMIVAFVRKADKYRYFCVGASFPIFMTLLLPVAVATAWLCPQTLDSTLRQADVFLGLDGFALTRWMLRTGAQRFFVVPVYSGLPLVMAIAWLIEESRTLLRASAIGAVLALPFYMLVPAAGPQYAFANFPQTFANAIAPGLHPRNCFPSMHFTWALLLALNMTGWRRRLPFIAYAAAMAIATVSSGEHYFVDILAAIPFSFLVQDLAAHVIDDGAIRACLAAVKRPPAERVMA